MEHVTSLSTDHDEAFYASLARCHQLAVVQRKRNASLLCPYPVYAFQRVHVFEEPETSRALRQGAYRKQVLGSHPFVSRPPSPEADVTRATINARATPFVFDHKLKGQVIVPGATYVEIALASVHELYLNDLDKLSSTTHLIVGANFAKAKFLTKTSVEAELYVKCFPDSPDKFTVDITNDGSLHATATVSVAASSDQSFQRLDLDALTSQTDVQFTQTELYDKLASLGFTYGDSLRCIQSGRMNSRQCLVKLVTPAGTDVKHTHIHPSILDSVLQACIMFPTEADVIQHGQLLPWPV